MIGGYRQPKPHAGFATDFVETWIVSVDEFVAEHGAKMPWVLHSESDEGAAECSYFPHYIVRVLDLFECLIESLESQKSHLGDESFRATGMVCGCAWADARS